VDVLRLLMVDDHAMLTEALSVRLATHPDLWIVGSCTTGDPRLPELVGRLRPDVLMIDPQPVGRDAGALLERLAAQRAGVRIVVLTGAQDARMAIDVARAGASAWVSKDSDVEEMTRVLRSVHRGCSSYPPELLGAVLRALREDARRAVSRGGPLDVLSARERDVLAGMVAGMRGPQIAAELLISAETVRTHIRSILGKLRVRNQVEAISLACAVGLPAAGPGVPPRG
jgi:two-component system, NarL family, response regulator LiaR